MDSDNQEYYDEITSCSRLGFKDQFAKRSRRMGLHRWLSREELVCLHEASFLGALCNISFNGLGGCGGSIRPEKEPTRCRLEQAFMDACDNFFSYTGWKLLSAARKKSIKTAFLTVAVAEENLN